MNPTLKFDGGNPSITKILALACAVLGLIAAVLIVGPATGDASAPGEAGSAGIPFAGARTSRPGPLAPS